MHYSVGDDIEVLRPLLSQAIKYQAIKWKDNNSRYLLDEDGYYDLVTMLSMAVLLEVSKQEVIILMNMWRGKSFTDNDILLELLFSALLPKEEYEEYSKEFREARKSGISIGGENGPYVFVKGLLALKDKKAQEKYMKTNYIKHWYRRCKNIIAWYNIHKENILGYYGYWSFESVALTKILGLDDSSYRDNQFYPKDMIRRGEDKSVEIDTKSMIKEDKKTDNSFLKAKSPKALLYDNNIKYVEELEKKPIDIIPIGKIESLNNIPIWLEKNPNTSNPSIYENIFWEIASMGEYLYYLAGDYQKNEKGLLRFPTALTEFKVETNYEDDVIKGAKSELLDIKKITNGQLYYDMPDDNISDCTIKEAKPMFPTSSNVDPKIKHIEIDLFPLNANGEARIEVFKEEDDFEIRFFYQEFREPKNSDEYERYLKITAKSYQDDLLIDDIHSHFIKLIEKYANMPYNNQVSGSIRY
jgi:hypothetical protein